MGKPLTVEEKNSRTFARKLMKLNTELCAARLSFPSEVSLVETKIHRLKVKFLGENYQEKTEAEKQELRKKLWSK